MTSRGNQHCASCIGTLSFPVTHVIADVTDYVVVNRTRKCASCIGTVSFPAVTHVVADVTAYVTVYTLVLIAAVRYMTIVHGARTASLRRRSRVVAALAVIWVGMLLVNAPILGAYAVRRVGDADRRDCDLTDQSLGRPMHHAGPASGLRLTGSDLDPDSNTPTLGRPTTPDAGWTPSRIRTPTHSWGPIYKISYDYHKFVVR